MEISGRRSTNSAKLKASNQEERVKIWRKEFQRPTRKSNG